MPQSNDPISISDEQLQQLVDKVQKKTLSDEDWKLLLGVMQTMGYLLNLLRYQKTTVQKLKDFIFGPKTEKKIGT